MSIMDKITMIKQVLQIVLKVTDILVTCITSILEKMGEVNNG